MRRRYLVKPTQTSAAPAVVWVRSTPSALRVAKLKRRRKVRVRAKPPVAVQTAAEVANEKFLNALATDDGKAQLAASATSFIKMRLREESFARKILMPVLICHR